jgi:hypothetical protein
MASSLPLTKSTGCIVQQPPSNPSCLHEAASSCCVQVFTAWGLLSGALFVAATANTFIAIHYLGLSVASGLWCGTAVLTSFAYGVGVAGDQLSDKTLAGAALLMLVAGIVGIAAAGQLGQQQQPPPAETVEDSEGGELHWRHPDGGSGSACQGASVSRRVGHLFLGGMQVNLELPPRGGSLQGRSQGTKVRVAPCLRAPQSHVAISCAPCSTSAPTPLQLPSCVCRPAA